jgi:hypothetical protein
MGLDEGEALLVRVRGLDERTKISVGPEADAPMWLAFESTGQGHG